jgi:UDP-N-acetylmuramoyl-tripeptide--D-alanyl-D-alanine ligase
MKEIFKRIIVSILVLESRILLWRFQPYVIMITGSVGKTSTKDAVFEAVSTIDSARKSLKSFNSDIGVPLTVLNLDNAWSSPLLWLINILSGLFKALFALSYPKYLVLEVGADHPKDLQSLCKWIKPNMVVATRFPAIPVHVEFYKNPSELIYEETFPARVLNEDGILILNNDDEQVISLKSESRGKIYTYGLTPDSDVFSKGAETIYDKNNDLLIVKGINFKVLVHGEEVNFDIEGVLGVSHVYPALSAIAVALALGGNTEKVKKAFHKYQPPRGRMNIIQGIKGATLIDDTYNSSPVAAELALRTLQNTVGKRHIAVLGDMRELGSYSADEHRRIGRIAGEVADILITVGVEARLIADGALDSGLKDEAIFQFEDSKSAGKFLESIIQNGDLVLIKGSQGVRMERTTEEVMMHPENKEKLLVRQDIAWQKI